MEAFQYLGTLKMKNLFILPLCAAFLISCETTGETVPQSLEKSKTYEETGTSQTAAEGMARIRLVAEVPTKNGAGANTSPYIYFYTYDDAQCSNEETLTTIRSGGYWGSKKSRLGISLWDYDPQTAKEFEVNAGHFRSLIRGRDMMAGGLKYSCGVLLEQELDAGSDYEMVFEWESPKNCSAKFNKITGVGETAKRQLVAMKTNKIDGPSSCEAQFRKNRWGN